MKWAIIFSAIVAFAASMPLIILTENLDSDEIKLNITSLQAIAGFTLRDPIEIAERLKNIPLENAAKIVDDEVHSTVQPDEVNDRLRNSQEVLGQSSLTEPTTEAALVNKDE